MPVEQNVMEFLQKAATDYGRLCEESFSQEQFSNCSGDLGMESPIEKLLWIAIQVVCKANCIELNDEPIQVNGKDEIAYGMHFWPQFKLDRYRADFRAYYKRHKQPTQDWVIECDGHDFHDRNKQERQAEKQRDRYFTVRGYKILRFTGSEIFRDPYAVAVEIVKAVSGDEDVLTPTEYLGA